MAEAQDNPPLLKWPNSESIQEQVMEIVWEEDLGHEECYWHTDLPELPVTGPEIKEAAPDLEQALREAVSGYRLPNSILNRLEEEAKELARESFYLLSEEQKENLRNLLILKRPGENR